jgi:hypothetical protein
MTYRMGWIGTVAFQVLEGDRELVFHLADGLIVPPGFKEGDDIDVILHADHPANIAMGMNSGCYEVIHLKSGKKFEVPHKTGEWRFTKMIGMNLYQLKETRKEFIVLADGKTEVKVTFADRAKQV